jgi:TRAP-type mannitol/chloroaromatic compound transport system permease small subunit
LLDIVGLVLFTSFIAFVTWHGYGVFKTSLDVGARSLSPLGTYLVIPQALWVLGFVLFLAVALLLLLRAFVALATGDLNRVRYLLGSRTIQEELAGELSDIERRQT